VMAFPLRESCQVKYTESSVEEIPTVVVLCTLFDHTPMDRSMLRSVILRFLVNVRPWSIVDA